MEAMSTSLTLQELTRQIRRDTLSLLDAAEPEWLTYTPPGTSNHILWHAGHILWLLDVLCIQLLNPDGSELPENWDERFGMNCASPASRKEWPSINELKDLLHAQLYFVLDLLEDADEEVAEVADSSKGHATIEGRIIHALHDEAKHSGEIYLLMKLCRNRK